MDEQKNVLNSPPPRMNIIGSGKLGRTLARLLHDAGLVTIGGIYNRHIDNSESARAFIGDGCVVKNLEQLTKEVAELWMIATSDDAIHSCAKQLAALPDINWQNAVVFHSSGLKTSAELGPLKKLGSSVASAHPAHSFASPQRSLTSFASTVCTLEGDERAIDSLDSLFSAIGGQVTTIKAEAKPLYHAATVMASNYLVALLGASEALLEKAGIEAALASAILSPLMRQSLENGLTEGAVNALTGPIARGDSKTIQAHLKAIEQAAPGLRSSYTSMGTQALQLARQKNTLSKKELANIEKLLIEK
ncbi:MAG: DUF2520 domain-containing protein [Gammaproteobacteria bacterium]|nr:DUF2520 domain-containing protein [Gammaproteobacteria bacterium]MBQ0839891.1 DUF2520 domain-containing protein [Gammaproteobacteria bacterium]